MKIVAVFLISPNFITRLTCSFHILKNVGMLKIPITKEKKTLNGEYSRICPPAILRSRDIKYIWHHWWTSQGCARFPQFVQNFSEPQILWSLYSVDCHTLTLQLPIQTLHFVEPELQVFVSSLENCQNCSKTSTPQLIGNIIIIKQPEHYPKSYRHPKSMNNLTLNKPAIKDIPNACFGQIYRKQPLRWLSTRTTIE